MKLNKWMAVAAIAILAIGAVGVTGCSSSTTNSSSSTAPTFNGVSLTGAGATFPGPVYSLWTQNFVKVEPGAKINYQAVGSGGGITQFTAKTVDFGATDVPLKSSEASAITDPYIEFPTVLGAVVVAYNVPGITSPLKLDGTTVANIFLGKIKNWNDPAIAAQNSGVTLPNLPIQVAHRADSSGTTGIFTQWLSMQSPDWKTKVGAGKAVQWPTGQGGNGNAGVAQAMTQTQGAIGYLELQYAATTTLGVASIKAPDGTYVAPTADGIAKAGQDLSFPITETTNILDSKTPGAYPISSTTYILIYKSQTNQDKAQTLVDFWTWALTKGQAQVGKLNYVPLPSTIAQDSISQIGQITANGTAVKASASVQ
ncbi:MAG: phosphate ABC transporter substrate-binding protein PstS [Coriobacteriia bacterium]|nr:phosphate ABC transporter substrate-binding protein PstS [Coriobacteriia bacterium]